MALTPGALLRQTMSIHQHYAHYAIDGLIELGDLNDRRAVNARRLVVNLRTLGLLKHSRVNQTEENRAWNECLTQYRLDLRTEASELRGRVDDLAKDLEQFCQALEHLQALTLDSIARQLQSPEYAVLLHEQEASRKDGPRADPFYREIRDECTSKLAVFESDPRYRHLRDRQFGTEHYAFGPIRRMLDGWLARQIDYYGNRQKESMLLDMQLRNQERNPEPALSLRLDAGQMAPLLAAVQNQKEIARARKRVHSLNTDIDGVFYDFYSCFVDLEAIARCLIGDAEALFESLPISLTYRKLTAWEKKVAAVKGAADPALVADTLSIIRELLAQDDEHTEREDDRMVRYFDRLAVYHLYNHLHRLLFIECGCDFDCDCHCHAECYCSCSGKRRHKHSDCDCPCHEGCQCDCNCVCKEGGPYRFDASPRYSDTLRFGELAEKLINEEVSIGTVARLIRTHRQPPEIMPARPPEKNREALPASQSGSGEIIPLSEKMGAMGIVDELRARRAMVDHHLDLPRRRLEIAGQIRSHYQGHGIAFDDDLIEMGVREFFSSRLGYETPKLGQFRNRVSQGLVNRTRSKAPPVQAGSRKKNTNPGGIGGWISRHKVALWIVAIFMIVALARYFQFQQEKREYAISEYDFLTKSLLPGFANHQQKIEEIELRIKNEPNPIGEKLLDHVKKSLKYNYGRLPPVDEIEPGDDRKIRRMQVLKPIYLSLQIEDKKMRTSLENLEELLDVGQEIDHFLSSDDYKKAAYYFINIKDEGAEVRAFYDGIDIPSYYASYPRDRLWNLQRNTKDAINIIRQHQAPKL